MHTLHLYIEELRERRSRTEVRGEKTEKKEVEAAFSPEKK